VDAECSAVSGVRSLGVGFRRGVTGCLRYTGHLRAFVGVWRRFWRIIYIAWHILAFDILCTKVETRLRRGLWNKVVIQQSHVAYMYMMITFTQS
jgi:hypothetical protein